MSLSRISRSRVNPLPLQREWRDDPKRQAELKIYDAFVDQQPKGWSLYYHVKWLAPVRGGKSRDGETDFVVCHPEKGVLLIEVKGGAIAYTAATRTWTSRDREGIVHVIKDPFSQVIDSKHALLDKLKHLPTLENVFITLFHSVAFPHVGTPNRPVAPDGPPEIMICANDVLDLDRAFDRILSFHGGGQLPDFPNGQQICAGIHQILASDTEFPHPLKVATSSDDQEIVRLTNEQSKVLDQLNRRRRVGVGGCAGSGKTFLCVEKARRLAREGNKTLLTCFNSELSQELTKVTKGISNLDVTTFHSLCWRHIKKSGIVLNKEPTDGSQAHLADALVEAMLENPEEQYDAILVDEAQDFHAYWWLALEHCLRGGREGILYCFYDDNQLLYHGRGKLPDNLYDYDLVENIRNSRTIFNEVVKHYTDCGGRQIYCRAPIGQLVEKYEYETPTQLERKLSSILNRLLYREQIPSSEIVVLTPKGRERSALLSMEMSGGIKLVEDVHPSSKSEISCFSVHKFKGLDRRHVIFAELDDDFRNWSDNTRKNDCYVGLSRARAHLILLGTRSTLTEVFHMDS